MEWIKIDPKIKDSIPNEPVWVYTIKTKKVVFVPKDEHIPFNFCSHYRLLDKPEPPKD
jgi:hypothetical protein